MKEAGVETPKLDPAEPWNVTVGKPSGLGTTDALCPPRPAPSPTCPCGVRGRPRGLGGGRPGLHCPAAAVPWSRAPAGRASELLLVFITESGLFLQLSLYAVCGLS